MATVRKRGNTYQIRVSCGYDKSGNPCSRVTVSKGEKPVMPLLRCLTLPLKK